MSKTHGQQIIEGLKEFSNDLDTRIHRKGSIMEREFVAWTGPSYFDNDGVRMIEEALGENPIILRQNSPENITRSLNKCKAVIIAGGIDIHPSTYGRCVLSGHNLSKFDVDRDYREYQIINYCIKRQIPMLGICRGHQIIGCFFNMYLCQDISDGEVCHAPKSHGVSLKVSEPSHWVQLLPKAIELGFHLEEKDWGKRRLLQSTNHRIKEFDLTKYYTNSFHHQALRYDKVDVKEITKRGEIDVLGTSIVNDGETGEIIELMMSKSDPWLSCQWHPEYDWDENPCSRKVVQKFKEMIPK